MPQVDWNSGKGWQASFFTLEPLGGAKGVKVGGSTSRRKWLEGHFSKLIWVTNSHTRSDQKATKAFRRAVPVCSNRGHCLLVKHGWTCWVKKSDMINFSRLHGVSGITEISVCWLHPVLFLSFWSTTVLKLIGNVKIDVQDLRLALLAVFQSSRLLLVLVNE